MLDVKHLRVLLEIVERGGFSAAADALSYTQGAVSQQIAALEREVGMTVLDRDKRPVALTEAGRVLVEHAEQIFAEFAAAERELEAVRDLRAGRLTVGSFATATLALGAGAIGEFRARYPGVDSRIVDGDPTEALEALTAGTIELVLLFDYDLAPLRLPGALQRLDLLTEPLLLALPASHQLAYEPALELRNLAGTPWVAGRNPLCVTALEAACRAAGFTPRVTFHTDDYATTLALVAGGVGAALVPNLATSILPDAVVLRPLRGQLPARNVAAVWPARHASQATMAMVDILADRRRVAAPPAVSAG